MMKILVTGANGQLGKEFVEFYEKNENVECIGLDRKGLDVKNFDDVYNKIKQIRPDVIVNASAYTNVDGCETDYKGAYEVNVSGARNLAKAANEFSCKLIHISTDFVFDGRKSTPYFEYDATNPISVYGKTKLAGEQTIQNECKQAFIIRTSWLYGKYGNNFVKTMIKLGNERDTISVVTDQVGSPTLVTDLIKAIDICINSNSYGIYHFSNLGTCSWNEFSKAIFKHLDMKTTVLDTTSAEFIRPASRPAYSVMDTGMIQAEMNLSIRNWEEALKSFLNENYK